MSSDEPLKVAQTKREIAGVFGRTAPLYDRVGPRFFSHFGGRLVDLARVPGGARVLDVATGRGAVLLAAANAVGPDGHVTGIDLSSEMVGETAAELGRLGLENVDVRRMDAEDLQFADGSFDLVVCGFALFFFPRLDRALGEIRRVLKPGGTLAVTTWESSFDQEWKWFDELVATYLPQDVGAEATDGSQSPQPPALDKADELEAVMNAAGFVDVRVVSETAEFVYADEEELWSSLWSHGTREGLEAVQESAGPEGLGRFKVAVIDRLRTIMEADGIHQLFPVLFTLAMKPEGDAVTRDAPP